MSLKEKPVTPLPDQVQDIIDELFMRRADLTMAREGLIQTYQALTELFDAGGILFLCGNGGSFADAMHIKGELAKSFEKRHPICSAEVLAELQQSELGTELAGQLEQGFPVIVLGESHSLRSAFANDTHSQFSYAQEFHSFAAHINPGVLVGISTSGNSRNINGVMTLARAYRFKTIGFTGPGGGEIAQLADICWRAPGGSTAEIQENQAPLYHGLCRM
ncbi:MAG: SIS domain-containing protein, partial [Planctomycetes bacterium]|nr:SIS domain-containing protein [Planctomycetota bacterium]